MFSGSLKQHYLLRLGMKNGKINLKQVDDLYDYLYYTRISSLVITGIFFLTIYCSKLAYTNRMS